MARQKYFFQTIFFKNYFFRFWRAVRNFVEIDQTLTFAVSSCNDKQLVKISC